MQLTDEQSDIVHQRIINDGVTDKGLQNDLLDHYCCYIEEEMQQGSDFETAYNKAFRAITPNGMHEIEEELHFVLTIKDQTSMKRVILITGAVVAATLTAGIIMKYLFMPGSAMLIVSGILLAALVFIPLVAVLKIKEKQTTSDKALWGIGSLFAATIVFSVLFKVQHWPGANMLGVLAPAILLLLFLPVYFFSGIRNRDTKVNTVVTSVFIIVGCGLFFTMVMTPRAVRTLDKRITSSYLRSEQILKFEQMSAGNKGTTNAPSGGKEIYAVCNELKSFLLKCETGSETIDADFENRNQFIGDHSVMDYFYHTPDAYKKLKQLAEISAQYNSAISQGGRYQAIPITSNILDIRESKVQYRVHNALEDLVQIQMTILQNEKV